MSEEIIKLQALNKHSDYLPGYKIIHLERTTENPLEERENFVAPFTGQVIEISKTVRANSMIDNLTFKWSIFVGYCLDCFKTRASDYISSQTIVLFSKRVRDRLVELEVGQEEAVQLVNMMDNEEKLRNEISKRTKLLSTYHCNGDFAKMIEIVTDTCLMLDRNDSPNFFPALFMLVLDIIDCFGNIIYAYISSHKSLESGFLKHNRMTSQQLTIDWSMRLSAITNLLPKILLQISFLRCIKYHPYKTIGNQIELICQSINGIGSSVTSIYLIAYLSFTVFMYFPEQKCDFMSDLFILYTQNIIFLQKFSFMRLFHFHFEYSINQFLLTHEPALDFFIEMLFDLFDASLLQKTFDQFYLQGTPSSFILKSVLKAFPIKYLNEQYPVLLHFIDNADDVVSKAELLYLLSKKLSDSVLLPNLIQTMNDIWTRISSFTDSSDFIYVSAPLSWFICKFCPSQYIELYLRQVASKLSNEYSKRNADDPHRILSKRVVKSVQECIIAAVDSGKNFQELLAHVGSIITLMDFLDDSSLIEVSMYILNDINIKWFELNDPLCIRVLLELSHALQQTISLFSPPDVVERIQKLIEKFLYRVDFGNRIDNHLQFLMSARNMLTTSSHFMIVLSKISLRLCCKVYTKNPTSDRYRVVSLLSFCMVTIPSIEDQIERAGMFLQGSIVSLICREIGFSHIFFDYFVLLSHDLPSNSRLMNFFRTGLAFLYIMPSKPEGDCLEVFRTLIKMVLRKKWTEDVRMQYALDTIIIGSHMQRKEYMYHINGVPSNDTLYAGSEEFIQKVQRIMNQMVDRLYKSLKIAYSKGYASEISLIPIQALRAVSELCDLYMNDEELEKAIENFMGFVKGNNNLGIKEYQSAVGYHLRKTFNNPKILQTFFAEKQFTESDDQR